MARLEPYFPKSYGKPRVDDRRVLSGIIFVNRNGLRWRDAPKDYGPHKTLCHRWKRWGNKGIFLRMMEGLATPQAPDRKTIMIDATYFKAQWLLADRGYDAGWLRDAGKGNCPLYPGAENPGTRSSNTTSAATDAVTMSSVWSPERLRRVPTRYDRCPKDFFSVIALAATVVFWF